MKSILLSLLALCTSTVFGQTAINSYAGSTYSNNGYTTAPMVTRPTTVSSPTMSYTGGVAVQPGQRVRYVRSDCGQFQWRVVEAQRFTPGYWVVDRGCRRWVADCYTWYTVDRSQYWGDGRGYGRGRGHGHGHGHGHHRGHR